MKIEKALILDSYIRRRRTSIQQNIASCENKKKRDSFRQVNHFIFYYLNIILKKIYCYFFPSIFPRPVYKKKKITSL